MLYACDAKWWETHDPWFDGLQVSLDPRAQGVIRIPSFDRPGLSLNPGHIHEGGNSAYQALNLAVLMGARRVLLLGCDMRSSGGKRHWHGDHPGGLNNPVESNYRHWLDAFATVPPSLEAAGVEVINCSPDSALRCFPCAPIESVIDG